MVPIASPCPAPHPFKPPPPPQACSTTATCRSITPPPSATSPGPRRRRCPPAGRRRRAAAARPRRPRRPRRPQTAPARAAPAAPQARARAPAAAAAPLLPPTRAASRPAQPLPARSCPRPRAAPPRSASSSPAASAWPSAPGGRARSSIRGRRRWASCFGWTTWPLSTSTSAARTCPPSWRRASPSRQRGARRVGGWGQGRGGGSGGPRHDGRLPAESSGGPPLTPRLRLNPLLSRPPPNSLPPPPPPDLAGLGPPPPGPRKLLVQWLGQGKFEWRFDWELLPFEPFMEEMEGERGGLGLRGGAGRSGGSALQKHMPSEARCAAGRQSGALTAAPRSPRPPPSPAPASRPGQAAGRQQPPAAAPQVLPRNPGGAPRGRGRALQSAHLKGDPLGGKGLGDEGRDAGNSTW
jgi:hypothetical protein